MQKEGLQPDAISVFPFEELVSPMAGFKNWVSGFLTQHPVHLVVIKGKELLLTAFLNDRNIPFKMESMSSLTIPHDTSCEEIINKGWAWIMDLSSQKAAESILVKEGESVWDACSGSGGKALFLKNSIKQNFNLLCTDKRSSVLSNLLKRFELAKLAAPEIMTVDLESATLSSKFDVVILDVPCTGSGTWGRNPENIKGFKKGSELNMSVLQRNIAANAWKSLKPGGRMYYITCSVFLAENESNVAMLAEMFSASVQFQHYFGTESSGSDCLFVAELRRSLSSE